MDSVGKVCKRNRNLFWKSWCTKTVAVALNVTDVGRFEHICRGQERVVSEKCCIETSVISVNLFDFVCEIG
jgi:hypothetical protein